MKSKFLIVIVLLTAIAFTGCVQTKAGSFKRTGLFSNLEFEEADADVWETDATGHTNHFEHWNVKGLKSDTQKALETANKGLDLASKLVK